MPRTLTPCLLVLGLLAGGAAAQATPAKGGQAPLRARLVAEARGLVAGSTASLGLLLELADGWHTYAPYLNDSGLPITIEPSLPAGFTARAAEWPAPQRHVAEGGLLDHVYEGRVLLPLAVDVPASAAGSTVTLRVHVGWMVCKEACQLGEADLTLELPVLPEGARTTPSAEAPLFAEARARTAQPLPAQAAPLTATWEADALQLRAPGAAALAFYPDADAPAFADLPRDGARSADSLVLRLREGEAPAPVRGVAELRWPDGRAPSLYRIDVDVPSAPGRAPRAPQPEESHDVR
jgi:DsbC/DsbD-like thiol-disulfide interchange protein